MAHARSEIGSDLRSARRGRLAAGVFRQDGEGIGHDWRIWPDLLLWETARRI
jgi:hypothetical protein